MVAVISPATVSAVRPSARASSVEMPCTALAPSGISISGSASQFHCDCSEPSGSSTAMHADTMRLVSVSTPVVSRSKTASRVSQ